MKFPVDAPRSRVVKALQVLGFQIVRERTGQNFRFCGISNLSADYRR